MTTAPNVDVVVPTIGRPSLRVLLEALAAQTVPVPRVIVVDDRPGDALAAGSAELGGGVLPVEVLRGGGRGPAAARNTGWRAARSGWVAFLDDDVVPPPGWFEALLADLADLDPGVAGSQGRIRVPLPRERRPTDWERNVAGLERARWATADMAYRRDVLAEVGGFDERFPRAYREDADLGLRVTRRWWRIETGDRWVTHPVRPADPWVSVRLQRGNADDALMDALHGPGWREEAAAPAGRFRRHLATTAAGVAAVAALAARGPAGGRRPRGRRGGGWASVLGPAAAAAWAAGTADLVTARLRPGPLTPAEVATVAATSVALPPAATWHRLRGIVRARRLLRAAPPDTRAEPVPVRAPGPAAREAPAVPAAVLFDRDGTLVRDVPYNGDPGRVEPMPGARRALDRLRAAGVPVAVVSNQSGVGRGRLSLDQVQAVNRRVEELLGPLGPWLICPHAPGDGCPCRKPAPGLVLAAAAALGVEPAACVLVGDIGADVDAARAAGARAVLVPTEVTRPEEVAAAAEVAADLEEAVDRLLGAGR